MPAVLNGANEIAVDSFLDKRILFTDIPVIVEETMARHNPFAIDCIESVMEADYGPDKPQKGYGRTYQVHSLFLERIDQAK